MPFKAYSQTILLPNGHSITLETGKLAQQAHGSALVQQGNTILLATVVSEKQETNPGFLPLSVDYQEKYAAAGKIPGGFLRREGKLTDHEVLVSRLVDRAIRPCFPKNYFDSVQLCIMLLSLDPEVSPDPLAALAASTALTLAPNIPFVDPISEVRIARIEGKLVVNPASYLLEKADMDIIVAAAHDRILMVEGEMKEVAEEDLIEAIQAAHQAIQVQCQAQTNLAQSVGIVKEEASSTEEPPYPIEKDELYKKIYAVAKQALPTKEERKKAFKQVYQDYVESLGQPLEEDEEKSLKAQYKELKHQVIRDLLVKEKIRIDGRTPQKVRAIDVEVDILPRVHGSALFTRGETQVLTTLTLGSKQDEQLIDGVTKSGYKKYMHHYDFPSFSTGEVKPNRGPSRREIGHGNLASRSITPLFNHEETPYTIRIHSTALSSNGSTSMGAVCSASLALMDGGITLPKTIGGIAMGLVSEKDQHVVITDISGEEDAIGDMDFKVAGTRDGITACQMDIKIAGLSYEILGKALAQAKKGRLHIIEAMEKVLPQSRATLKTHAPRIETLHIPRTSIGAVIGPGGKVIQEIQRTTNTVVNVSEEDDQGIVYVLAPDKTTLDKAVNIIKSIVKGPEIGEQYQGIVKSIQKYGAFVEFLPNTDGLLHISQVTQKRITEETLREMLPVGKEISVTLIEVKGDRYSLSMKTESKKKADTQHDSDN